jgi:hypothetical protein
MEEDRECILRKHSMYVGSKKCQRKPCMHAIYRPAAKPSSHIHFWVNFACTHAESMLSCRMRMRMRMQNAELYLRQRPRPLLLANPNSNPHFVPSFIRACIPHLSQSRYDEVDGDVRGHQTSYILPFASNAALIAITPSAKSLTRT